MADWWKGKMTNSQFILLKEIKKLRCCHMYLKVPPGGGVDNKVPQLHTTQSDPLD